MTKVHPPARAREVKAVGTATVPGLPVGTRIKLKDGAQIHGTVMPYQPECSQGMLGLFPVRLDNAIWQICDTSDVTVLEPNDTD